MYERGRLLLLATPFLNTKVKLPVVEYIYPKRLPLVSARDHFLGGQFYSFPLS